jgi:hypothetical protein
MGVGVFKGALLLSRHNIKPGSFVIMAQIVIPYRPLKIQFGSACIKPTLF